MIILSFFIHDGWIETAKKNAYRKADEELINMYWCVGQFISEEAKTASYGDALIDELFYETYADHEKVSPVVT